MFVLCKYFTSNTRLLAGMRSFSTLKNFHFHTVSGLLVWNKGAFKLVTPEVTALVMGNSPASGKNIMALVTNNEAYKDNDGKPIDLATVECEVPLFSLCNMLREKYDTTGNVFELDMQGDGRTAKLTMDGDGKDRFKCVVKSSSGDFIVTGDDNLREVLRECTAINAFHYCSSGPEFEKEVSIRRGYGEILKEIARYLNRTLILTSIANGSGMLDICASAQGILEIFYKADGDVMCHRVPPSTVKPSPMFCISFTTQSIEDLSRSRATC